MNAYLIGRIPIKLKLRDLTLTICIIALDALLPQVSSSLPLLVVIIINYFLSGKAVTGWQYTIELILHRILVLYHIHQNVI